MATFQDHWRNFLDERDQAGLMRQHQTLESAQTVHVRVNGKSYLNFCSNDYLGLANHPEVSSAAINAIKKYGVGSGASHLVIGHHEAHQQLEEKLATFTGRDKVIVFSSGYMANMALVASLVGKSDVVLQDKLNHASLLDGGLLSGARFQRYLHNDVASLSRYLAKYSDDASYEKCLIATDGVFSMDGDIAPLQKIKDEALKYNALVMVDDAHGLGVLGEQGKGTLNMQGLSQEDVPVLMGTFGKALGTSGAFIAGPALLIDYLTQAARPYIYTTAMPPAIAAATTKSIDLVMQGDELRLNLSHIIARFREQVNALGYILLPSNTAIQPLLMGDSVATMKLASFLKERGFLVGAIRPPTVPDKTARLRITLSAAHQDADVDQLVEALAQAKKQLSLPDFQR